MPPEHQCSSHQMFEKMLMTAIDNLAEKFSEGIKIMTSASSANGADLKKVLENQGERRELCGKQGARIASLEVSDRDQWKAIDDTRKKVWIGMGVVAALQLAVPMILHFFSK